MEYLDKIFLGDGIAGMKIYPDNSIDMILCDLPYGMTDCAWDNALDFGLLWSQYWRILKDNGAVVLTAAQPFTTDVINSCRRFFRYCCIGRKICRPDLPLQNISRCAASRMFVFFTKKRRHTARKASNTLRGL